MPGELPDTYGITWEPIWDTLWMPKVLKAGNEAYKFFNRGIGDHDPNDPIDKESQKTLAETNCPGNGKLESDEEFQGVAFALCPDLLTADPEDVAVIWNRGIIAITGTGNSKPFQIPMRWVTCGTGFTHMGSTVGVPDPAKIIQFPQDFEINIREGKTFGASLIFSKEQKIKKPFQLQLAMFGPHRKSVGVQ